MYQPMNWTPYLSNPIDYADDKHPLSSRLITPDNTPVIIKQEFSAGFVVIIGGQRHETGDNLSTCYFLNQHQIGYDNYQPDITDAGGRWITLPGSISHYYRDREFISLCSHSYRPSMHGGKPPGAHDTRCQVCQKAIQALAERRRKKD